MYAGRLAEVREPLWRAVLRSREGSSGRRHLVALMDLCIDDFHRGEWQEAAELAAEGSRLARSGAAGSSAGISATIRRCCRRDGPVRRRGRWPGQITTWAGARGARTPQVFARHALFLADSARSLRSAYHHATWMSRGHTRHVRPALPVGRHGPGRGAVRTHQREEADRHVRSCGSGHRRAVTPSGHPGGGVRRDRRRGHRSLALFGQALSLPGVDQWPFDVARCGSLTASACAGPGPPPVQDPPGGRPGRLP